MGKSTQTLASLACLLLATALLLPGCNLPSLSNSNLESTQLALGVRQTMLAMQNDQATQTSIALNVTLDAQATLLAQPTAAPAEPSSLDLTPLPVIIQPPAEGNPTPETLPLGTSQALTADELKARMKTANILLYEDMVGKMDTNRYVQNTLDRMGLNYTDIGSAKGWLKSNLLGGAPGGGAWDLVIVAAESKSGVSGEFFEYVTSALDAGSAVILEVWYLDQTYTGTAAPLLARCGVEFDKDWRKVPPSRMVMFPVNGAHPILNEPNTGLSFTDVTSYWAYEYDIGDWMKLTPGSNAQLVVGTSTSDTMAHGTVTVCLDGQLILQTFSSHQLTFNAMRPVWENYIYQALKWRLLGAP